MNTEIGLNWSDYGARWYDSAVGRWNSVDPLSSKYSNVTSFNYTLNNPILFIDPDGKDVWTYDTAKGELKHISDFGGNEIDMVYHTETNDDGETIVSYVQTLPVEIEQSESLEVVPDDLAKQPGKRLLPANGALVSVDVSDYIPNPKGFLKLGGKKLYKLSSKYSGNISRWFSSRKRMKDARPKAKPHKPGNKRTTRQSKNKDGTGNKTKTDKGSQKPHLHDENHGKTGKKNIHYRKRNKKKKYKNG